MTEFLQMVISVVDELFIGKTNFEEISENHNEKQKYLMNVDTVVQHSPRSSKREIVFVVSSSTDVQRVYSTRQKAEEFRNNARNLCSISEFEIDGGPAESVSSGTNNCPRCQARCG